jgi:NADH:ubiquinone oxidoreductase subunit F (NADH-binding)
MTATARGPAAEAETASIGGARLLRGLAAGGVVDLGRHRQLHGDPKPLAPTQLIQACTAVNLAGRGGAGFPVARKLASLGPGRREVLVNAAESEPASGKDRLLVTRVPHLVLDGALLVAGAIGARTIQIAVHDARARHTLTTAIAERPDRRRFTVHHITGGFVSGEAGAVLSAVNGAAPIPPGRKVLPSERGVGGHPTFLSNAETFAHLAVLSQLGPDAYRAVGTNREPGTTLITVAGAVARTGVLEVALGTPLDAVLSWAGAPRPTALIIGGYHGAWVNPRPGLTLSRGALAGIDATLGAGIVLVLDDATCALGELSRVTSWLAQQSTRQCGPCTFGLPALFADLQALLHGTAQAGHLVARHAAMITGRGACNHPDGAVRFVTTGLAALSREVELHRRGRGCGRPILGQLPLTRSASS